MQTLTLSDHTQAMVASATNERAAEYQVAKLAYEKAQCERKVAKASYKKTLADAWHQRRPLLIFIGLWNILFGALPKLPAIPTHRSAGRDEVVWATGAEGERKVATFLERALGNEWTLVCGYKNQKGEIDQILVGPSGVFAIEIKFINGLVHCDGDRWWRDKFDKYDNLVEKNIPIADKKGRGPSRQLNEATDRLQDFLDTNFGKGRVRRAVILSHESSRLGDLNNVAVDLISTLNRWDITGFLGHEKMISEQAVAAIVDAIQRDHRHHIQAFKKPRAVQR